MYTKEQEETALKEFERTGSIQATVQVLGYPSRATLYWFNCYDRLIVAREAESRPDAVLANLTLDRAIKALNGEHPVLHSDRGCHYRWPGWLERIGSDALQRSMSRKGCSPDNAACEGFWGV
ncbi:hypothetical protein [Lacrimispora brassicae]